MLDAGSSHTQITMFKMDKNKFHSTNYLTQIDSQRVEGGITEHNETDDLIDQIKNIANPIGDKNKIYLYLSATAGFRLLNITDHEKVSGLFRLINKTFHDKLDPINVKSIKIITGKEEALFCWISINYLNETLFNDNHKTIGILDMGGASAQIAYESINKIKNGNEIINRSESGNGNVDHFNMFGFDHSIKLSSSLCFGNDQARIRYYHLLITKEQKNNKIDDPCLNKNAKIIISNELFIMNQECLKAKNGLNLNQNENYTLTGSYDNAKCKTLIHQLLDLETCKQSYVYCFNPKINLPPNDINIKFYAISTYYYTFNILGLNQTKISKDKFDVEMDKFCNKDYHQLDQSFNGSNLYLKYYCFQLNYVYGVLDQIYKFNHWENIQFINNISKYKLNWSFGYMVNATNYIHSSIEKVLPFSYFLFILIFLSIVLSINLIYLIYKSIKKRKSVNKNSININEDTELK